MKFVDYEARIIQEDDPYKKIELAGRTCYKSEEKITESSARKFFNKLVKSNHVAMVEHAAFAFLVNPDCRSYFNKLQMEKYLNTTEVGTRMIVSGNIRAINEAVITTPECMKLLGAIIDYDEQYKSLCYTYIEDGADYNSTVRVVSKDIIKNLTDIEILTHTYTTFLFTEDRGVTHEHVRHRPPSFGQESTRYCNYSKDGFGNEITYTIPSTWDSWHPKFRKMFKEVLLHIEEVYLKMVDENDPNRLQPQQARAILPQATKADIVITANGIEWKHIFNLRYHGLTGTPHPDMKYVMSDAYQQYCKHVFDLETLL